MVKNYRIEMRIYDEETDEEIVKSDEPFYNNEDEISRQAYRLQERMKKEIEKEL